MHVDLNKLVVGVIVLVGLVVLLALSKISEGGGLGLIGLVIGYVFGNGKSVVQGNIPGAMLTPTPEKIVP